MTGHSAKSKENNPWTFTNIYIFRQGVRLYIGFKVKLFYHQTLSICRCLIVLIVIFNIVTLCRRLKEVLRHSYISNEYAIRVELNNNVYGQGGRTHWIVNNSGPQIEIKIFAYFC